MIYKYFDEINEVVNRKAVKPAGKDKRALEPRTRKKHEQSGIQRARNIILINLDYARYYIY